MRDTVTKRDRKIWDNIAAHWDEQIGEGNDFQKLLIIPATDRLLAIKPGERDIDACSGNGNYSRRLSRAGARVTAFDGSAAFVELAKKRTLQSDGDVAYHLVDACDANAVAAVAETISVDAYVCSMAMMDLPTLDPLLRAARKHLKANGRFVFSVSHPCWNSNEADMTGRLVQSLGEPQQIFGVEVTRYAADWPHLSRGLLNQPEPHWMYHRSLSTLFSACFKAGFVIDAMEEPLFPEDLRTRSPFSWARRPDIPPAIIIRIVPSPGTPGEG